MRVDVVTIFPEMFSQFMGFGIPRRAAEAGLVELVPHDLRDHSGNKHRQVDDYPYGGGGGMVLKAEPFYACLEALRAEGPPGRVLMPSARGKPFTQDDARRLAREERLIFFCGHYKGIDARVDPLVDEEICVGDVCVSGGEVPTLMVLDACIRLLEGAVGDRDSIETDSHYEGLLGAPEYTRPEVLRDMAVPPVLLSGHHAKVEAWRREQAEELTRTRRPDLWERFQKK